ncbi:MAG: NB-ARC domain-containing protein [Nostochopsis sp.]
MPHNMNQQQLDDVLKQLTPRRQEVLRLILAGESNEAIADALKIKPVTVRKYLERLYETFGISKRVELVTLFAMHKPDLIGNHLSVTKSKKLSTEQPDNSSPRSKQDLGEAPDTIIFYGRTNELDTLEQWIIGDRCRVVALLGMGGLGKTALSVKLVQQLQSEFDYIIWRSLRETPKLETILDDAIKFLSDQQVIDIKGSISDKVSHLLDYLRSARCLLILDNFESILADGAYADEYREEYEDYSILIQRLGQSSHQSCLLLTSRTQPKEIAVQGGENLPIRSLLLQGLQHPEAMKVLEDKGLSGSIDEMRQLVELYSGNPLALKILSTFIKDLFNGNVSEFIAQEITQFVGIESLLDNQFEQLTELEQKIMYWLAINREPVYVKDLYEDMVEKPMFSQIIESLENLRRRSLIETVDGKFTLQNVVMEYMIALLVRQVSEEINSGDWQLFNTYALIQATAKDYVRHCQTELILKPVAKNITDIESKLVNPLQRRDPNLQKKGYAVGNILNLLRYFDYSLSGLDLSHLKVWQAYLRGADLRGVKFIGADLDKSRFTEAFGTVLAVASSSRKSLIAMGDTKSKIRLRHPDTHQFLTLEGHTNWVRSIVFNPDGEILASASDDKTLMLWNTRTGQRLKTLKGHKERVWSVAFSPNGNTLASASEDRTVRLWNIHTGECTNILERHVSWVRSVAFSLDGKILASGSSDKTVILWNANTGEYLRTLKGHSDRVRSVTFSPDSKILASGSDDHTIRLWNVPNRRYLRTLEGHTHRVRSVAFSPDGNILASASEDYRVILWDTHTGQRLQTLSEHTERVWSVTFIDDKVLISSSDDKTVKLWDAHTGQCLKTLQGYTDWAWSIVFHPEGNILVSGNDDKSLKLWDTQTGKAYRIFSGHTNRVRAIAVSQDGSIIASGSDDQSIKLWDVQTGQLLKTLVDHTDRVLCVAFSPDGDRLVSGGDDKTLRIWDINTGECRQTQESHKNWVWSITFSPDGSAIASASEDRTVKLWDANTGECLKTFSGHNGWVRAVRFSPDGKLLASGSEDETVKIWDVNTGECVKTLKGKTCWVRAVVFSSDGRFLAVGGEKPIVEVWDINTGQIFRTFRGHQERIWSVNFSPNSNILASSSEDGTIRLWNVETGKFHKLLRAPRLYEGMDITGVVNLTKAQINTLKTLGATKNNE